MTWNLVLHLTKQYASSSPIIAPRTPRLDKTSLLNINSDRAVRSSTIAKTESADKARKLKQQALKSRAPVRAPIKHKFTQKELLLDALSTEESNERWLRKQKELSQDLGTVNKMKLLATGNVIRFTSRRGTYDTVTFTEVDSMPSFLRTHKVPKIPEKKCIITGEEARYRDPVTGHPYANIEAFKELKRKFHRTSWAKHDDIWK